ncbi:SGNH/GDSL hydrolase family protein [Flavobacterium sp. J49]|uniref:SGNH/GDSL hydrolase family protein n=1 Tax=Flavobacterium sp. J49 TaxID=2718534 RepID=UPI001592E8CB|nr:SGNH/GDSL hydrolase family protein [Flavobacterium sp. J49]MBF6641771.1 SGNH/GDSL hydrolase family protein [Flavobacterium sp. J49]NIC03018.1 SGNH/GDSL hydrolase family protein [Flavobacterium sp. J49]
MRYLTKIFFSLLLGLLLIGCSSDEDNTATEIVPVNYKYLALGDSYTYGQSVCETCRFPEQLKDGLEQFLNAEDSFNIKLIAQTGWTTTNLKTAIGNENLPNTYDLVTLLIGVNNQYQGKPFSLYEQEFPELVNIAITKAGGDKNKLIVVSIPDYAYTPFGQGSIAISEGVYQYNAFAKNYCETNNITFVNITDITRLGLLQPELVASDGLHPSTIAYAEFVERILPEAKMKLGL